MSTEVDPKAVREIAWQVISAAIEDRTSDALNCILEERGLIESAWAAGYTPWHGAVAKAVAEIAASWPGEQTKDGAAHRPPAELAFGAGELEELLGAAQDEQPQGERNTLLAALTAERNAAHEAAAEADKQRAEYRREAALLRARVRELEGAQSERDGDVRAVSGDAYEAVLRFADTWRDKDAQRRAPAGETRKPSSLTVRATGAATLTEPELRAVVNELEQLRERQAWLDGQVFISGWYAHAEACQGLGWDKREAAWRKYREEMAAMLASAPQQPAPNGGERT